MAKIRENCILELANQSKFVKYRALEKGGGGCGAPPPPNFRL